MSVAKTIEITAGSPTSFDDAVKQGIARAGDTLENIRSAWIQDQEILFENGAIKEYRVRLRVTFILR